MFCYLCNNFGTKGKNPCIRSSLSFVHHTRNNNMYLHISRRSHSHTWGQQSSGVVSQEIHIKRLLVRCAVMSECILRDLWHHFTHYSVCMHQVRECLCVCAPRAFIAPLRAPLISFLARSYIY